MKRTTQGTLLPTCILAALLVLSACGGGDEAPAPAAQTITFASPGNQSFGPAPVALVANASSGLTVSLASSTPAVCSVNSATLTLISVGSCSLTASQVGNAAFAAATSVSHSFSVLSAPQTITFVSPGNQNLGTVPAALVATSTSGLAVNFESTTRTVCTVSGTTLNLLAAGTCTVGASQAGNSNYNAATPVVHAFLVAMQMQAQTISFMPPGNQLMGAAPSPLVATSSSGLTVSFTATTPTICTVSGNVLTLVTFGTCTLAASQAGDAAFAAAAAVLNSFTVAPAAQTIGFTSPGNQTLGTAPAALSASATSGLTVAFTSTTQNVCTVTGTTLNLLAPGSCSVSANQAGNTTFGAAAPVTHAFTVATAAQTISFTSPGNQTLGTAPAGLLASSSSGLPVALLTSTAGVCTVSGNTLTLVAAGICTLNASQAGNSVFAPATVVVVSFTVAAAAQTISFASPGNQTLGTAPAALVASATSGLAVTFASTTPGVCTVSGSTLTLLAAGTCSVSASQAGNSSFAAATAVINAFNVAAAAQTITFASPGIQTLGTAPAALVASATSGLAVTFASTTQSVCTVNGSTLTLASVGTCTVTASQAGNGIFAAATAVARSFSVAAAPLTPQAITFTSPGTQTMGTAPAALSASATSGLTVLFASTTQSVCTVSGNTLTLVAAGSCSVSASQGGNSVFAAATPVSNTFTVVLAAQSISFTAPGNQTLGTAPPALVASASSGLTVAFASTTNGVCSVSGSTLTLVAAGTCSISASQAGDATFAAATPVARSFTVAAALGAELVAFGGFENAPVVAGQFAQGWRGVNGPTAGNRTTEDARSGNYSAVLRVLDPGFGGSGLVANSVDDGGQPSILGLHVGKTTVLTFWAKGNASVTGNVNFSLRYLDAVGNILNPVVNTSFQTQINTSTWTLITRNGPAIPANTVAIFLEMTLATGPTGVTVNPDLSVSDYGQAKVLVDDVSVRVVP